MHVLHIYVHVDTYVYIMICIIIIYLILLPEQQNVLHASSRVLIPVQDKPPHEGVGLLHDLVNFFIPPPHVLLHDPSVHELHLPSTTKQSKN